MARRRRRRSGTYSYAQSCLIDLFLLFGVDDCRKHRQALGRRRRCLSWWSTRRDQSHPRSNGAESESKCTDPPGLPQPNRKGKRRRRAAAGGLLLSVPSDFEPSSGQQQESCAQSCDVCLGCVCVCIEISVVGVLVMMVVVVAILAGDDDIPRGLTRENEPERLCFAAYVRPRKLCKKKKKSRKRNDVAN